QQGQAQQHATAEQQQSRYQQQQKQPETTVFPLIVFALQAVAAAADLVPGGQQLLPVAVIQGHALPGNVQLPAELQHRFRVKRRHHNLAVIVVQKTTAGQGNGGAISTSQRQQAQPETRLQGRFDTGNVLLLQAVGQQQ